LYCFHDQDRYEKATQKALELLQIENLQEIGAEKKERLLAAKSDINDLFIREIDQITGQEHSA
ncbi:MAG TPA: hypothetical protein PK537_11690, partial [Candidatus Limiplasma sp.]|nr:hypothetical protein [Candidatus Limiplasma sp.]